MKQIIEWVFASIVVALVSFISFQAGKDRGWHDLLTEQIRQEMEAAQKRPPIYLSRMPRASEEDRKPANDYYMSYATDKKRLPWSPSSEEVWHILFLLDSADKTEGVLGEQFKRIRKKLNEELDW